MTITAKFPGTCRKCNGAISKGSLIEWSRGNGAAHVDCNTTAAQPKAAPEAKCWNCDGPGGKPRNHGAGMPYVCDTCHADCVECAYQRFMRSDERCEHCRRPTSWDYSRKRARCMNCCPTCHGPISKKYAKAGYQCDSCADIAEGAY